MKKIVLDGESLTLETLATVVTPEAQIRLAPACRKNVQNSRQVIDDAIRGKTQVYGITTGFGAFSDVFISKDKGRQLQKNILMSHAAGVGNPFPDETVRGIMALMINSKAKGYSGIRWSTLNTLVNIFNSGIIPRVPEKGSVGASGDLAPLAHLSLVLIGRGQVRSKGRWISGSAALKRAKIDPVALAEGEGLALINGTQVMTAIGAHTVHQAEQLAKLADIAAAMSLEVLLGSNTQFHKKIHRIRPHQGQTQSAANLRKITEASEIISSHKDCDRIQDAYSLRCSPQVHGASRDTIQFAKQTITTELNSATENPLVFPGRANPVRRKFSRPTRCSGAGSSCRGPGGVGQHRGATD